jgi:hypothetical protein
LAGGERHKNGNLDEKGHRRVVIGLGINQEF